MGKRRPAYVARSLVGLSRTSVNRPYVRVPFDEFGNFVIADLRTPQGKHLYRSRRLHVDADHAVLRRCLKPGDVFVDGGANVGHFTLPALALVGPSGGVVAYEPATRAFEALTANVATNGYVNAVLKRQALGAEEGQRVLLVMPFADGLSSFAPERPELATPEHVDTTTLDTSLPESMWRRIRLVKLDLEGAEGLAVRGGQRLLTEVRPWLLVEVEESHLRRQGFSSEELFAELEGLGYEREPSPGESPNWVFTPNNK